MTMAMLPRATFAALFLFSGGAKSLSTSSNGKQINRRGYLQHAFGSAVVATPFLVPSISNAISVADDDQQGIAAVTDSQIGKAFRRSVVKGAQVADRLDEKWERFSDSLRDKSRCDPNTGRRLYDNGKRKDGTPIGNPGLGELCAPEPVSPLDVGVKQEMLDAAVKSALVASGSGGSANVEALNRRIQETKDLVRPSFERSMQSASSEDEKNRGQLQFEMYSTLRAIADYLRGDKAAIKAFQLAWGKEIVSMYAPNADRRDYISPFPEKDEEFQDFDYDKNNLLDALGRLKVTLDRLKRGGFLGFYEISIPYDDYGSVVTIALDDYAPISAEILLSEQNYRGIEGPMQALARALFDGARINCGLDTFYIDPSTTRQVDYNPTQLLLSLSGLSEM